MKFHRLLAGTAVAALMTNNASALDVALTDGGDDNAFIASPVFLALEADHTAFEDAGSFALEVSTDSNIIAGNYVITLRIQNGTFGTEVTPNDLMSGSTVFGGRNIDFNSGDGGAGNPRPGERGDSSVSFFAGVVTGGTDFSINFDATANCAGPLNFSVSIETELGRSIEEGSVQLEMPAATCVNALAATVRSDAGANDSILVAPEFSAFNAGGGDTATEAVIGNLRIVSDPSRPTGTDARAIYASLADAEDDTGGSLALGNGTGSTVIDTVSATIAFDNTIGIEGVKFQGDADVTELNDEGSATITNSGSNDNIVVVIDGTTTLIETQPSITAGTMTFSDDRLTAESVARPNDGLLDDLQYAGQRCGTFDWVGDSTTSRRNVFRITNFANSQTNGIFASMTNSSAGLTSTAMPINEGVTVSNSEMSFTDELLTDTFGEYGRADFSFNFIGATASLDCDRLQSSPVSSVVTAFGNDNGATGDGDD